MNEGRADDRLVADYLAGDKTAFAGIYDRYSDSLYDTAAAMLSDRHEAADVMQDVFLIAAERLSQLRDTTRLKPWLFAILRNQVYTRTKRRSRTRVTDFSSAEAPEMAAPVDPNADGEGLAHAELAELVRAAAAGLDPRDQLVLEYSMRQDLSGADLADALGVSLEQSYVVVHRMRDRVERTLGALTVARMGRKDCDELQSVLKDWDGTFSVLIRKRVARHIEDCDICTTTKRKFAVLPMMSVVPAMAAPLDLRDRVLGNLDRVGVTPTHGFGEFAAEGGGFPVPVRFRPRRFAVVLAAAATALVLLGGGVALSVSGGSDPMQGVLAAGASTTIVVNAPAATLSTAAAGATSPSSPSPTTDATDATVSTDSPSPTTTASIVPTTTTPPGSSSPATTTAPAAPATAPPTATAEPVPSTAVIAPPATSKPPSTTAPKAPPPTTAAPTVPSTDAPTETTAPTVVTEPIPETTAPPPTTAAPTPGNLALSTTIVDLGGGLVSADFSLTNTGQLPLAWSVDTGAAAPFTASAAAGSLEPGQSASVGIGIARGSLAEGDFVRHAAVTSSASGGGSIELRASVDRAPIVTITKPVTDVVCPAGGVPTIGATVTDESALSSVVLSWSGPGTPGSRVMHESAGTWFAQFDVQYADGIWTYTVTATDARGSRASADATATVACPG